MSKLNQRFNYVPLCGGATVSKSNIDIKSRLGKAIYEWLYKHKYNSVKHGTFTRLLTSYRLLIKYPLAEYRLLDLTSDDIQKFVNTLTSDGYSKSTIKKAYELVSAFLRYAIGDGVPINPLWVNVNLPTEQAVFKHRKQVESYDNEEQARIRAVCEEVDNQASHAVILLLETGIRIGELLALDWSDVQWQRRAIRIHRTMLDMTSRKQAHIQDVPKSNASVRTVPLSTRALTLLKTLRDATEAPYGLVFSAGSPDTTVAYNPLMDAVRPLLEQAGVPWYGFHAFRHTFATNCYYKGCDVKRLSKLLGHANVTITYNTYIHLYGDCLEELRSIVE